MGNPLAYRPLTQHFYFYFNQLLFDLDPTGHHLSNLLVHLVNGLLVFWLARRWISPGSAWIAAALFWFHPAHFYEVFWVSGISQSGFVFCLLSVLYCWSRKDEDRWGRYWRLGAWVAAAAAFLSKEDAVMLPAIVTVFSWLFGLARPFFRKQTCFELVPFWVLLSAYLGLRFWILGFGLPEGVGTYEFGLSLNLMASKILTYLQWMSPKLDAVAILLPLILIWICCLTSARTAQVSGPATRRLDGARIPVVCSNPVRTFSCASLPKCRHGGLGLGGGLALGTTPTHRSDTLVLSGTAGSLSLLERVSARSGLF